MQEDWSCIHTELCTHCLFTNFQQLNSSICNDKREKLSAVCWCLLHNLCVHVLNVFVAMTTFSIFNVIYDEVPMLALTTFSIFSVL